MTTPPRHLYAIYSPNTDQFFTGIGTEVWHTEYHALAEAQLKVVKTILSTPTIEYETDEDG